MTNKVITEIENITIAIKAKSNTQSFNETALAKFELLYFLTMDIVRYELKTTNHLSHL